MPECCAERANRERQDLPPEQIAKAGERGGVPVLEVCRVCGTKHRLLYVDPVRFGLTGRGMGASA